MKGSLKIIMLSLMLLIFSCEEPETVVTNYVHPDGTVTRVIEMRNLRNEFSPSALQVPFDSTWSVHDSLEIGRDGDTTWIKRAEKTFRNVEEINMAYSSDSGANRIISRSASLEKRFRWFNTGYRFSERIEKAMEAGFPVSEFLNEEELRFFYSPDALRDELKNGADSLHFRSIDTSVDDKTEIWASKSIFSEWINEFSMLTARKDGGEAVRNLEAREDELFKLIMNKYMDNFDSLWAQGIILGEIIGEQDALRFRVEADSALNIAVEGFFLDFKDYSVRTMMPGKLTGTNGFTDSSHVLLWPVRLEYFVTEPYEMWAESKVPNIWSWVVSGIFILFVMTGIILRAVRKHKYGRGWVYPMGRFKYKKRALNPLSLKPNQHKI